MNIENLIIESDEVNLSAATRNKVIKHLKSDYYSQNYQVSKIKLTIYNADTRLENDPYIGHIEIFLQNKPKSIFRLKSSDLASSIMLAIEHAYLKLSHNLADDKTNQKRISENKKSILYGSHRPYS